MNLVCFCFFFVLKFSPMCRFHNKGNAFPFSIMLSGISLFCNPLKKSFKGQIILASAKWLWRESTFGECFKLSLQVRNDYDEKVPLVYQEPGYECRSWTSLETRATKEFIHSRLDPDNINWESGFKERGCQQSKSMHLGQSVTNLTYQHHVPFEKILRIETHQWLWAKIHMYSCC